MEVVVFKFGDTVEANGLPGIVSETTVKSLGPGRPFLNIVQVYFADICTFKEFYQYSGLSTCDDELRITHKKRRKRSLVR